jgi:hypothetical protein
MDAYSIGGMKLAMVNDWRCGRTGTEKTLEAIHTMFLGIEQDRLQLAFSLGITSALFLLGPGAYSVDCHLFGRRLILPSDSK